MSELGWPFIVFFLALAGTFAAAWYGRKHENRISDNGLAEQKLNKWLIGLSGGATANSGFVVTGAVGLGYVYGAKFLLLPIAWLLGDIAFWLFFPEKINEFGRKSKATTIANIVGHQLMGSSATILKAVCATIVLICLSGYTMAQWVAGQKFLGGAFNITPLFASLLFAGLIVTYTSLGGFRGSVYADAFQAIVRIVGTIIALGAIIWVSSQDQSFGTQIQAAVNEGTFSLNPFSGFTFVTAFAFVGGYAAAAFGFGLGQPQMVSRYLAGANPEETKAAWWIYMSFVQFTWIAMTVFGLFLRGVMIDVEDPESGLSFFFQVHTGPIILGIIVADVFATMAAATNSILVAMTQTIFEDILKPLKLNKYAPTAAVAGLLGIVTMAFSMMVEETVFQLAMTSVSLMGAGLAPAVLIKIFNLNHSALSLILTVSTGFLASLAWKIGPYSDLFNEAGIGIFIGLVVNLLFMRKNTTTSYKQFLH